MQAILGHRFRDPAKLREALTHRSAAHGTRNLRRGDRRGVGSNERLEFIGDRVLGLLMAEWLLERYPQEQEGELGPRQARLVSRGVLAVIAERAGLSEAVAVAPNEARAGVGTLSNVRADALEAVVGALFLDGGIDVARDFVRRAWAPELDAMAEPPIDPKTQLQEWLMARGKGLPAYAVVGRDGPSHEPLFTVEATGGGKSGTGQGGSKQAAERQAATDLLRKLKS